MSGGYRTKEKRMEIYRFLRKNCGLDSRICLAVAQRTEHTLFDFKLDLSSAENKEEFKLDVINSISWYSSPEGSWFWAGISDAIRMLGPWPDLTKIELEDGWEGDEKKKGILEIHNIEIVENTANGWTRHGTKNNATWNAQDAWNVTKLLWGERNA